MINDTVLLGDICEVIAGQSPPSSTYNSACEGLPFFQGKADFGQYSPTVRIWCNSPQKIAEKGDILISVRAPVGPTNLCDQRACIGRGLSAIRPGNKIDTAYLIYFLKKNEQKLSDLGRGSTFSSITQKDLKQIQIPLPPLEEQKRIVSELDAADALRQKRKQAIALLDDYLKALFLEMFGDPVMNPKGWDIKKFGEVVEIEDGDRGKNYPNGDAILNNGILFLSTKNIRKDSLVLDDCVFISQEKFDSLSKGKLKQGDLILTLRGSVGNIAEFISAKYETGFINAQMAIIRPRAHNNKFFIAMYSSDFFQKLLRKESTGSAQPQLPLTILKRLPLIVPSIELQEQFAVIVSKIGEMKRAMCLQAHTLENNFDALVQGAFSKDFLGNNQSHYDKH